MITNELPVGCSGKTRVKSANDEKSFLVKETQWISFVLN